jgi:hypothetical protein
MQMAIGPQQQAAIGDDGTGIGAAVVVLELSPVFGSRP